MTLDQYVATETERNIRMIRHNDPDGIFEQAIAGILRRRDAGEFTADDALAHLDCIVDALLSDPVDNFGV